MAEKQTAWVDVTPFFDAVCKDLQTGELIHGENFSLFEAMSALEIMDPKMDAGITSNSIDDAVQRGSAPTNLSISQIIDIMDHLLACEATWHKGHTLAQTVFSCLYLLKLERIESNALLHSYCRTVRATCNLLRSTVSQSRTHEEEDFFTMAFGLPVRMDGDERCVSVLNAVEEAICRRLRACKNFVAKKNFPEDYEPLQPDPDLEEGYCKAVLCRLRFRKSLYHILTYMAKPQGKGLDMAHKHIRSGLSELAVIHESSKFLSSITGVQCKVNVEESTTASGIEAVGFDASINSRLLSPTPPRSIKLLSWKMALRYFEKLFLDLDKICLMPLNSDFDEILRFIVDFQKTQPDLVARSHLQILLVQDGKLFGRDPFVHVISRSMNFQILSNNHEFQKDVVAQTDQLIHNMIRILCTNIAWQRRKLGKCLQEWGIFLHQVEMVVYSDGQTPPSEKGSFLVRLIEWAEEQTCWLALRFLMLGFELELYFSCEFCMVYWYLEHVLWTLLHYKIKERSDIDKERVKIAPNLDSSKKKTKKKRGKEGGKEEAEKEVHLSQSILLTQCYMNMSKGLTWMLGILRNYEKALKCPTVFNTEAERFIQTFDLLQKSRVPEYYQRFARLPDAEYHPSCSRIPEALSYVHFVQSISQCNASMNINYFEAAQKDLKRLRHCFPKDSERLEEIRQLEHVAEKNKIAMGIINRTPLNSSLLKISFEFSEHPVFAVAVIKRA